MRYFFILAGLLLSQLSVAGTCDLSLATDPECFQARLTPTVRVILASYGSVGSNDLARVGSLFKTRFETATEGAIRLEIIDQVALGLKKYNRDLTELRSLIPGPSTLNTPDRLTRLWYYYNLEAEDIAEEVHQELKANGATQALRAADTVLVLSGAQFEGLGFATGGFGFTEQPSEIAWMTTDGGSTQYETDERLVDEWLHEMGHLLGLDHASHHCFENTTLDRVACCNASPGADDVMSYCRDRSMVKGSRYFKYSACTLEFLKTVTLPALLQGLPRPFQNTACL